MDFDLSPSIYCLCILFAFNFAKNMNLSINFYKRV